MAKARWISGFIARIKSIHWLYLVLHVPLLILGISFVTSPNPILVAVGGSLIATAMAGWVLFLHVWLSQEEFRRMDIIRKFGMAEAFEHRGVRIKQEYDSRLGQVSDAIDVMGFGLRSLKEDYHNEFAKWAARAKVRILLLDPEFPTENPIANQRDKEENDDPGSVNRDVRAFVRDCADLLKNKESHFQIRLYRCLPSINIFRIDDSLFWGPYLIGDVSRNFPTFLLAKQGVLYKRLLEHFDKIWSDDNFSRPVPSEWYETRA